MTASRKEQSRLSQLQEQITSSQSVLRSLEQHKTTVRGDIEKLNERLVSERKAELRKIEELAKKRVEPYENRIKELKVSIADLASHLETYEKDIVSADERLEASIAILNKVNEDNTEAKEINVHLESTFHELNTKNTELKEANSVAEQEFTRLRGEISDAEANIEDLKASYHHEQTNEQIQRQKREAELEVLNKKLDSIKQEVLTSNTEQQQILKNIASRTIALDDREKVLRRREIIVNQNEDRIQQNASLLDL